MVVGYKILRGKSNFNPSKNIYVGCTNGVGRHIFSSNLIKSGSQCKSIDRVKTLKRQCEQAKLFSRSLSYLKRNGYHKPTGTGTATWNQSKEMSEYENSRRITAEKVSGTRTARSVWKTTVSRGERTAGAECHVYEHVLLYRNLEQRNHLENESASQAGRYK